MVHPSDHDEAGRLRDRRNFLRDGPLRSSRRRSSRTLAEQPVHGFQLFGVEKVGDVGFQRLEGGEKLSGRVAVLLGDLRDGSPVGPAASHEAAHLRRHGDHPSQGIFVRVAEVLDDDRQQPRLVRRKGEGLGELVVALVELRPKTLTLAAEAAHPHASAPLRDDSGGG